MRNITRKLLYTEEKPSRVRVLISYSDNEVYTNNKKKPEFGLKYLNIMRNL